MRHTLLRNVMGARVIKHNNLIKLLITAEMIEMGMSVDDDDRLVRHLFYGPAQVANSTTGVDQNCLVLANDQIDNCLLVVTRLVENQEIGRNFIDFEPVVADGNSLEFGIRRSRLY